MSSSIPLDRSSPTTTAYIIATAIIAGVTGFFIGQGASLGLFSSTTTTTSHKMKRKTKVAEKESWPNSYDVKVYRDSSDEEEETDEEEEEEEESDVDGELASFDDNTEEVKLVLVVRTDLGMTKGSFVRSYFQQVYLGVLCLSGRLEFLFAAMPCRQCSS